MINTQNTYAEIDWKDITTLEDRRLLFCVNNKCMSGKVKEAIQILDGKVKIRIEFIEPAFFDFLQIDDEITVQEASTILAKGRIVAI